MGSNLRFFGQDSRMSNRWKEALKGAVEISLSSDKQSYKRGEPISLTATIKNVGEAPFYVFPRTSFEDDGDGAFIVRITETPKCRLVVTNMAGTPAPPAKDLKFVDYVQTDRVAVSRSVRYIPGQQRNFPSARISHKLM
jgi:hypothetical protein